MGAGASSVPGEDDRGVSNELWAKLDRKGAGVVSVQDFHDAMVELAPDDPQIAELDRHVRGLLLKVAPGASEPAALTSASLYELMAKEGPPNGMVDAEVFYGLMQKIYSPPTPSSSTTVPTPPSPAVADAGGDAPPPPGTVDAPTAPPLEPSRLDINAMYSTLLKGAGGGETAAAEPKANAKAPEPGPMALPLPPMMMADAAVASRPAADPLVAADFMASARRGGRRRARRDASSREQWQQQPDR